MGVGCRDDVRVRTNCRGVVILMFRIPQPPSNPNNQKARYHLLNHPRNGGPSAPADRLETTVEYVGNRKVSELLLTVMT